MSPEVRRRRTKAALGLENLEGRQLLSSTPTTIGPTQAIHTTTGAAYTLAVSGPGGVLARPAGRGAVNITLFGTTSDSQVVLSRTLTRNRFTAIPLQIKSINVRTGQLGSFQALNTADLVGPISPLSGNVSGLQFDALGPNARIDVAGNLGQIDVLNGVNLGPNGLIHVGGNLTTKGVVGGSLTLNGSRLAVDGSSAAFTVAQDVNVAPGSTLDEGGPLTAGGNFNAAGSQVDVGGLTTGLNATIGAGASAAIGGTLTANGNLVVNGGQVELAGGGGLRAGGVGILGGGRIHVAGDLTGPIAVAGNVVIDAGQFAVDRDLTGTASVGGDLDIIRQGTFLVGRDFTNGLAVSGNVQLASGAVFGVGRDFKSLAVGGNLDTSGGGSLAVGGNLGALSVQGFVQGKGTDDISVGLTLGNLQVLGGGANQGGVRSLDLNVAKNIEGLDILHGIFNSFITAGDLIDGSKPTTTVGANVGPDGPIAVFDSEIFAGVQIKNLTLGGDVVSDLPRNPAGRPTRIVAGETRDGIFTPGGNIDNFQITGTLVDAVVAASVKPNGGDGTLTTTPTDVPGDDGHNTYDKPAGTVKVGQVGAFQIVPNFTAPPFDHAGDPTIDDAVLPGSINSSFAASPLPTLPPPSATTFFPLPSKSTVLGGVISTPHGDEADFAGIFAADTTGVFVGPLPKQAQSTT
jgi:hypothetical protein